MREISAQKITEVVRKLCINANCYLPQDVKDRIEQFHAEEKWPQAQEILERIIENYKIAEDGARPICQDTGLACVFVTMGQDVHVEGDLAAAGNLRNINVSGAKVIFVDVENGVVGLFRG